MVQNDLFAEDEEFAQVEIPFTKSILKSAIQKAVRRGEVVKAVRCAKSAMEKDFIDFVRRLAVIVLEDVILHPDYDEIVWILTSKVKKVADLERWKVDKLLRIVADITACNVRDDFFKTHPEREKSDGCFPSMDYRDLPEKISSLIRAIKYRSTIGGMQGDLDMLHIYAVIWYTRFKDGSWSIGKLKEFFPDREEFEGLTWNNVSYATVEDILPEAIDFHCSPMMKIIMREDGIKQSARKYFPDTDVELALKDAIWVKRSSLCYKKQLVKGRELDWLLDDPYFYSFDSGKLDDLYADMEEKVEGIAKWFLDKQR